MVVSFHFGAKPLLFIVFFLLLLTIFFWFSDLSVESEKTGNFTASVARCLTFAVALFIISEAILFFSLFWSFRHCSISPSFFMGASLSPLSEFLILPFSLPFFNLVTLVFSSATLNLGTAYLMLGYRKHAQAWAAFTLLLGLIFLFAQFREYSSRALSIADGAYASAFFLTTGVHGSHVMAGGIYILVNLYRLRIKSSYSAGSGRSFR